LPISNVNSIISILEDFLTWTDCFVSLSYTNRS